MSVTVSNTLRSSGASTTEALAEAHRRVLGEAQTALLARRLPKGHWQGQLSASALSTAVVSFAMQYAGSLRGPDAESERLVRRGHDWLAKNIHQDGGYGDTVRSQSNLPTTTLCWASLSYGAAGGEASPAHLEALRRSSAWIEQRTGDLEPATLKRVIEDLYGEDKTFSVPILTLCALAGVLGSDEQAFHGAPTLPFELALFPQSLFKFLGLPVVSYALPALIAVGQVQHHRYPSRNPVVRIVREGARGKTLATLEAIQPSSGGFLEATPLTGFVTLSLAGAGHATHRVVDQALAFFKNSVLGDGSWPIDENLATWVSTLSVQALHEVDGLECLGDEGRQQIHDWLRGQQYQTVHPFTGAAPGGWAWTDLPGGVPDADDTPGALLALKNLGAAGAGSEDDAQAAAAGIGWLLDLQNRDGGMPTFCRGWGKLPFDRSSPDLTAHSLRAYVAWKSELPAKLAKRVVKASRAALRFLENEQKADGSWVPLWFGNEDDEQLENRIYGTAKVMHALAVLEGSDSLMRSAIRFLLMAQNDDGGWGGVRGIASSFDETALAVDALAAVESPGVDLEAAIEGALTAGSRYLVDAWDRGDWRQAQPIGFYFANLWYFEELYPLVFSIPALARAGKRLGHF